MKFHLLLFIFLITFLPKAHSQEALVDSLRQALESVTTIEDRLKTMTNLMDASPKAQIPQYAKELYKESLEADDQHYKEIALTELLRHYINNDSKDTTNFYLAEAERELTGKYKTYMITYMKAIMDVRIVYYTDSEEGKKIIERNQVNLKTNKNMTDIEKMAANYILGMYLTNKSRPDDQDVQTDEIVSYFKVIAELGEKMPLKYAILFLPNTYFVLCPRMEQKERSIYASRYLKLLTDYTIQEQRPYTQKRQFLTAYIMLSGLCDIIGKEKAAYYYNKLLEYIRLYPEASNVTPEYDYLSTSVEYYKSLKDYRRVIALNDSLITFLSRYPQFKPNVVIIKQEQVALYDSLHMYKEAYQTYKECSILLDSARIKNMEEHMDNLEIQKNVNQLIIEKTALELELEKNKARAYLFLSLFLLSACAIIYVAFRLWKMKALYKNLQESNRQVIIASEKAQESEKMKNAFIKNMCHEVRTPLNAINGFSELITSEDCSILEKLEFSKIIYTNCTQLTSMMNDVLIIAQLDSSSGPLPTTPANIQILCMHEMEMLKKDQMKTAIEYRLEGEQSDDPVCVNRTYFSLVITHLLNNANKFTQKGSITLSYLQNKTEETVTVTVTDTGCGIPSDKQEWVFERFTKANEFIQGSGLGLYLSKLIILRMNGKIEIDPTYTQGTRILFTIPVNPA